MQLFSAPTIEKACVSSFFVVPLQDIISVCCGMQKKRWFNIRYLLWTGLFLFLVACNTTKFVPEGEYLLNKAIVKVEDDKTVQTSDLTDYLRQKQNTEVLGFWKLQLDIYNTAPVDTSKKANAFFARNAQKMGEPPVIFSPEQTDISRIQLQRAMQNKGYFHASVDTLMRAKKRKMDITYLVTAREPYTISNYAVSFTQPELLEIARDRRKSLIHEGMQFDAETMDQERQRVASAMRRRGCFYFDKEMIQYVADSTRGVRQVGIKMCLQDYVENLSKEETDMLFRKYRIAKVYFHIDYDADHVPEGEVLQTSSRDGYVFTWVGKPLLREKVLIRSCPIEPGAIYSEHSVERAYSHLNELSPVKYVDISFQPVSADELDCHIVLSRGKLNTISAEIEGTYSAGDWGIAAGAGYTNRNLFRGAEEFTLDGRCSYEWRQNGGRAIEAKAATGLTFPNAPAINLSFNYQNRPDEFTRYIFNAGLTYKLRRRSTRPQHQFQLLDISYVYLPWISDEFRNQFLQSTNILKYSYENHFIVGWGYAGSYTSYREAQPLRSYFNLHYSVETAGNLMLGLAKVCRFPQDSTGYTLFNIPFSQYAKGDIYFTYHHIFNKANRLVWHADAGVAVPYGNSQTVPFEKRYFAGGANSVRGWISRSLGPGGYRSNGSRIDYNNQSGDIRLNLNLEYRVHVWSFINLAAFVDAGNIWTIHEYDAQPYGAFAWREGNKIKSEFYKQIALAYGVGIRLDFSFFVFRVDFGVKLYDPSRLYGDVAGTQWRTVRNGLGWKDDMSFHFAIGYPF